MNDHVEYYQHRLETELAAADRAKDASVQQIHRALADRYRQLLSELGDQAGIGVPA